MENRQFGYVRVSSKEQNEERQLVALKQFGISERDIYIDKQSGKDFNRTQYQIMLNNIRENDLVVFLSLDRKFICNLTLQILAYVAEKERINIKARQAQGIEAAKRNNVKFGRPNIKKPDNWDCVIALWKSGQITAKQAMCELGLKKSTFYKLIQ